MSRINTEFCNGPTLWTYQWYNLVRWKDGTGSRECLTGWAGSGDPCWDLEYSTAIHVIPVNDQDPIEYHKRSHLHGWMLTPVFDLVQDGGHRHWRSLAWPEANETGNWPVLLIKGVCGEEKVRWEGWGTFISLSHCTEILCILVKGVQLNTTDFKCYVAHLVRGKLH